MAVFFQLVGFGTTSVHAENTVGLVTIMHAGGNYLRARGEYWWRSFSSWWVSELPPCTRRIRLVWSRSCTRAGTTSAHAENTGGGLFPAGGFRNYLRARGEYGWFGHDHARGRELPPRTRRILVAVFFQLVGFGTTSVHAENTVGLVTIMHAGGNYLRARGEYSPSRSRTQLITELPPHARRILGAHRHHHRARGNYLRMRGEYPMPDYSQLPVKELPPHARRILLSGPVGA